jgi:hypothetical protein
VYMQHRYYDSRSAQFLSVDQDFRQTAEAYDYALNDPLAVIDPTGDCISGDPCCNECPPPPTCTAQAKTPVAPNGNFGTPSVFAVGSVSCIRNVPSLTITVYLQIKFPVSVPQNWSNVDQSPSTPYSNTESEQNGVNLPCNKGTAVLALFRTVTWVVVPSLGAASPVVKSSFAIYAKCGFGQLE